MKKKNDEKVRFRRLARLAIALVAIALFTALLLASSLFALHDMEKAGKTPEDLLVRQRFEKTDSYAILHERAIDEPRGKLYLVGWHDREAASCIGLIWIAAPSRLFGDYRAGRANAHCFSEPYSIDQYWGMRSWPRIPFSVAYGFSGSAARVVVTWQDDSITELQPRNGSYLAVNSAKSRVIDSVEFFDEAGVRLHQFPDGAGHWRAGA